MIAANTLDASPLNACLSRLNELFKHFCTLLKDQTKLVIQQNLDGFMQLTDQQVLLNEELSAAESELLETLTSMTTKVGLFKIEPSVTNLEPYLVDSSVTRELRSRLQESIKAARSQQAQLLSLIQFGQQHITETLRAIHHLGNDKQARYDHTGRLVEPERGRVLNQKG
jgi:hypothetical protein